MTKNRASKELKLGRPYLITFSCLIILFVYLILPSLLGSYLYVKYENPEIKSAVDLLYGFVQLNLPQNNYLRMGLLIFTFVVGFLMPFIVLFRYWKMNGKGVKSARNLCLLNIALFYLHFRLIDELLEFYPYIEYLLTSLLVISIAIYFSGFLYKRRMK